MHSEIALGGERQGNQRVSHGQRLVALRIDGIDEIGPRREIESRPHYQRLSDMEGRVEGVKGAQAEVDAVAGLDLRVRAVRPALVQRGNLRDVIPGPAARQKLLPVQKYRDADVVGVQAVDRRPRLVPGEQRSKVREARIS